jgi:hypothetical protein
MCSMKWEIPRCYRPRSGARPDKKADATERVWGIAAVTQAQPVNQRYFLKQALIPP